MPSPVFQSLVDQYAAASLDKQYRFQEHLQNVAPGADWLLDVHTGILSFGSALQVPVQMLGTESTAETSWMWAWANPSIDNAAGILALSQRLRGYGAEYQVPELTDAELQLNGVNGYVLSMVATGLFDADAFYRGPYEGGAAFMLLSLPEIHAQSNAAPAHVIRVFMDTLSGGVPVKHRPALLAYLDCKGYNVTETPGGLLATSLTGDELAADFDTHGRLTSFRTGQQPPIAV